MIRRTDDTASRISGASIEPTDWTISVNKYTRQCCTDDRRDVYIHLRLFEHSQQPEQFGDALVSALVPSTRPLFLCFDRDRKVPARGTSCSPRTWQPFVLRLQTSHSQPLTRNRGHDRKVPIIQQHVIAASDKADYRQRKAFRL
jgi:hypothetical protein